MIRYDGFIDLCEVLGIPRINYLDTPSSYRLLVKYLKKIPDVCILKNKLGTNLNFSFVMEGVVYYFKYDSLVGCYNELIAEEVCRDLNIACVSYDLAAVGNVRGVISKSFKKENGVFKTGLDFIDSRNVDSLDIFLNSGSDTTNLEKYSNLEYMWNVLDNYYQNSKIVGSVMSSLVRMLMFAFLTGQTDQHLGNWGVWEDENGKVLFLPLYDNERFMLVHPKMTSLRFLVTFQDNYFGKYGYDPRSMLEENIKEFFKLSCKEYLEDFRECLWVLSEENFEEIIRRVEEKTSVFMPHSIKLEYNEKFEIQRMFLENVLEDIQRRSRKKS